MKMLFVIFFLFASSIANAQTYKCSFTEPFFSIVYDSEKGIVSKQEMGTNETVISTQAQIFLTGGLLDQLEGQYQVKDQNGKILLKLKYSNAGSDGMSDFRYPYDAEFEGHIGACYTDSRPVQNF